MDVALPRNSAKNCLLNQVARTPPLEPLARSVERSEKPLEQALAVGWDRKRVSGEGFSRQLELRLRRSP